MTFLGVSNPTYCPDDDRVRLEGAFPTGLGCRHMEHLNITPDDISDILVTISKGQDDELYGSQRSRSNGGMGST